MDSKFGEQNKSDKIVYPPNAIPLTTASLWTQNWRDRKEIADIKGFFIPMIDVNEVTEELGVTNVRGYLGINDQTEEFHFLIVGVDSKGNDMIDENEGQFVYDYTKPCPQQCGDNNVLNGGN
jgi:hypothetical protein